MSMNNSRAALSRAYLRVINSLRTSLGHAERVFASSPPLRHSVRMADWSARAFGLVGIAISLGGFAINAATLPLEFALAVPLRQARERA
jgi:hypothetical protein